MKTKTVKTGMVTWIDAYSGFTKDYAVQLKDVNDLKPLTRQTVGYILKNDEFSIVLAMDYIPLLNEFSKILVIPKTCVVEII